MHTHPENARALRGRCHFAGKIYCILLGILGLATLRAEAQGGFEPEIRVSADFPGGNVLVLSNRADGIVLAPDLRGGSDWFYWHFEAQASRPGLVTFIFPGSMRIGVRGPAVSVDGGATWNWLGTNSVRLARAGETPSLVPRQESFAYRFAETGQRVRFAACIPYLTADLKAFLAAREGNAHLAVRELAETAGGRTVPLLRIGEAGSGRRAMLATARAHACEAMASYVLEGFLAEALSESSAGIAFRKRYVLYAVPFLDVDGVEAGDQGKGRKPHDHNRDYGVTNRYAEIAAVQALAQAEGVGYVIDFHCPALRGDVHESFYFDGIRLPHIAANVDELRAWMDEELPSIFGQGPPSFLKNPPGTFPENHMPSSHYFGSRSGMVFAATLEVPYAQAGRPLDADMARAYGRGLLAAWSRAEFRGLADVAVSPAPGGAAPALAALRSGFQKGYRAQPDAVERLLETTLADPASPMALRIEAGLLSGTLQFHRKQYAKASAIFAGVAVDPLATARQRVSAAVQRAQAIFADPGATEASRLSALAAFDQVGYPAPSQKMQVYGAASACYRARGDWPKALAFAQRQLLDVPDRERAHVLNQVAAIYDAMGDTPRAIQARQEVVAFLRDRPSERSVFGAMMAGELCIALHGIPTATVEAKQAARDAFLNHPIASAGLKSQVLDAIRDGSP